MSKGMKGEKSLKKIINKEKLMEEEKKNYESALEIGRHVKVQFGSSWEISKIIDIRPIKEIDDKKKRLNILMTITFIT